MQNAAIVGAGGAGFPSFAKLADGADTLVINCAECEPLMYTDYMIMREEMSKIVEGAQIIINETTIKHAYVSLKAHKAEMLGLTDGQVLGQGVSVKAVPDVYPMGDTYACLIVVSLMIICAPSTILDISSRIIM